MANGFHGTTVVWDNATRALDGFMDTSCVGMAASSFAATWTPGSDHMGITSSNMITVIDGSADAYADQRIVIMEALLCSDATVLQDAIALCLAEEDDTKDMVRLSASGPGPSLWRGPVKLAKGKDLKAYLGKAQSGTVGVLSVTYIRVPA